MTAAEKKGGHTNGAGPGDDEQTTLLRNSHLEHSQSSRLLGEDVPFYSRPRQRQRWGDEQMLPHVNWGDLYIDLFYVAAAYNLGIILKHAPTAEGLLYFVCCFSPAVMIWNEKLMYDSRFAPDDNLYHRGLELLHLVILGLIVSHIRDVSIMKQTSENIVTLVFLSGLFLDSLVQIKKYLDVAKNVDGGPEAVVNAQDDVSRKAFAAILYLGGAYVAGHQYLYATAPDGSNIAILCALAGNVVEHTKLVLDAFVILPGRGTGYRESRVPMNLEFTVHRQGEWVMLMLGESVLSLLIVDISSGWRYYTTLVSGIVTVTILQYSFFRSQPQEIGQHAMRRDRIAGYTYWYALLGYSAVLIIVGVSYKMILTLFFEEEEENELLLAHRMLHLPYPPEEMKPLIARFYSVSLAVSIALLDVSVMSHKGWIRNLSLLVVSTTDPVTGAARHRPAWLPCFLMLIHYGLLAVIWNLDRLTDNDVEILPIAGMLAIIFELYLRTKAMKIWTPTFMAASQWPNVSQPQSLESPESS